MNPRKESKAPDGVGPGEDSVEIPDMPQRSTHMQTVPVAGEDFEEDSPPPYEPSHWTSTVGSAQLPRGAGTATTGTASSSAPVMTPASRDSPRSSISAQEHDGLMSSLGDGAAQGERHRRCSRGGARSCGTSKAGPAGPVAGNDGGGVNSTGYRANNPMHWWEDQVKWEEMEDKPGFCFSDSAGCMGSRHGGCCFSDHGGCFFSDYGGCCFSSTGGCFFSESAGCCFSTTNGCCCSSEGACCCSEGPATR